MYTTGQDSIRALSSNYMHGSFGLWHLNWINNTTIYPIIGSCATIISSYFALIAACSVKGIMCGKTMGGDQGGIDMS